MHEYESGESSLSLSSTNLNFSEKEKKAKLDRDGKEINETWNKKKSVKKFNHLKLRRIVCRDSSFITITYLTKSHQQSVSRIKIINEARWLFLGCFLSLLNSAVFLEAAGAVLKIGSSL